MKGEAATPTRCSAARWFRSLVLALSKCLVTAAPVVRPVVSMAPVGRVAGRTAIFRQSDQSGMIKVQQQRGSYLVGDPEWSVGAEAAFRTRVVGQSRTSGESMGPGLCPRPLGGFDCAAV